MTWPLVSLGDHLQFLTSGSRGWSQYVRESGALFLRIQNVGRNHLDLTDVAYVEPPTNAEAVRTRVRRGDVLLSITADLGRTCVIPDSIDEAYVNQHLAILRVSDSFEPRFISAYLSLGPGYSQLARLDRSAVKSGLNFSDVRSVQIPLPSLEEQRRIADILDKADAIRRKRKEAIALTEELLRSAFLEMFGDPVTNPKGWEVKLLGSVSEVSGGLQVTHARASNPVSLPYLRVANVFRDRIELDEVKEIRVTEPEAERSLLRTGDILIVEGHGNPNELGRSAVWNGEIARCTHQNHLIRVRPFVDVLSPIFVSAFLNSNAGRAQMLRMGKTTSGLNTISTNNVRAVRLLVPPLDLQRAFVTLVEKIPCHRGVLTASSSASVELFECLTQRAFQCQLTVAGSATKPQLTLFDRAGEVG